MQFDYASHTPTPYPAIDESAHLKAQGNIQYLKLIDLIKYLWEGGHPEVEFIPHSGQNLSDPDKGYIVYGLESRTTMKDSAKPRFMEVIRDSKLDQDYEIWMQAFENFISFSAVHQNPRTAEEIIEAFEDDMTVFTQTIRKMGVADILYSRRFSDREDSRTGQNVAVRTVVYRVVIQKIKKVEVDRLKSIEIDARVWWNQYEVPRPERDPIDVTVKLVDNSATPSY